ncbi:MAG: PQQ-binding-like beta-propeller repeat protein [Acidobacteria bacterium]|nr:PQQ-binding-like beta-propeller repeat protein [Acidobacteriota bacterium]
MARREYVSFLGERRRDVTFTNRGRDPGGWVLLVVAITGLAISVWWFGFREVDRVVAAERTLNDTTIPTLLTPAALEGSVEVSDVPLDCPNLVEEWTMFQGGGERTGCLSTLPIVNPEILWATQIGISGWRNNPVVDNGAIYVGSAGVVQFTADRRDGIYSLDLRTGVQRWRYQTELDVNSVAVSGGVVIGVGDEGRIWALSARDGTLLWSDDLEVGVLGDPLILGDMVIIGDGDGVVTAYDLDSGDQLWLDREPRLVGAIRGGASADGEHIYVATDLGEVASINTAGQRAWKITLEPRDGGIARVYAAPTVTDTMLIISVVRDGEAAEPGFRALDKETGEELWASQDKASIKNQGWANVRSSPAIAGGYIIFGEGYSNQLVVIDLYTGDTLWAAETGEQCFPHWPSPAVNNSGGTVLAYLARHDGGLYAVDLQTRTVAWKIYLGDAKGTGAFPQEFEEGSFCGWGPTVGHSILSSPAVASNGVVVVGTLEGYIIAIGDADWE